MISYQTSLVPKFQEVIKMLLVPYLEDGGLIFVQYSQADHHLCLQTFPLFKRDHSKDETKTYSSLTQLRPIQAYPFYQNLIPMLGLEGESSNGEWLLYPGSSEWYKAAKKFSLIDSNEPSFQILCIPLMHIPTFFLLLPISIDNKHIHIVYNELSPLLNDLFRDYLFARFMERFNNDKLLIINDELSFIKQFSSETADALLAIKHKVNPPGSNQFVESADATDNLIIVKLNDEIQVMFSIIHDYPVFQGGFFVPNNQQPYFFLIKNILKNWIESTYKLFYFYWASLHHCRSLHLAQFDVIIQKMEKYSQVLTNIADFNLEQKQLLLSLKESSIKLQSSDLHGDNEFYKGTTDWTIRFRGEKITLKGAYTTGLRTIHRLLQFPGQYFFPHELELIKKVNATEIVLQPSISLEVEIQNLYHQFKYEEKDLLHQVSLLKRPSETSSLEDEIRFYAHVVYLFSSLAQIAYKKDYVYKLQSAEKILKEKIHEFEEKYDNTIYVKSIINDANVIKKANNFTSEGKRTRERVKKSIENAIDAIKHEEFRSFLRTHIVWNGGQYAYIPPDEYIDWQLFF